jgi:hypothetical protein
MRILHCAAVTPSIFNNVITHPSTWEGHNYTVTKFVREIHQVHMRTLKNTRAFNDNYNKRKT